MIGHALSRPESGEKIIAAFAHVLGILFGFIPALVVYLAKKDSPFVLEHAREALNFQLTVLAAYVVSWALMFVLIGFLTMAITGIASLVLSFMAAIKASDGKDYRYPFTIHFVR